MLDMEVYVCKPCCADSWIGSDVSIPVSFRVTEMSKSDREGKTHRGKPLPLDDEEPHSAGVDLAPITLLRTSVLDFVRGRTAAFGCIMFCGYGLSNAENSSEQQHASTCHQHALLLLRRTAFSSFSHMCSGRSDVCR